MLSETFHQVDQSESRNVTDRSLRKISFRDSHLNSELLMGFLKSQSLVGLEELDLSGCRGLDERVLEVLKTCFIGESSVEETEGESVDVEESVEGKKRIKLKKLDLSDTYLVGLE